MMVVVCGDWGVGGGFVLLGGWWWWWMVVTGGVPSTSTYAAPCDPPLAHFHLHLLPALSQRWR